MGPRTFILVGRSGSGKGTQAKLLIEELMKRESSRPVLYIETGERFRAFISGDTFSARRSNEIYKTAERQPDFLAVSMWAEELLEKVETGEEHIIFDGTPRSEGEARMLTTALAFYKRPSADIIHLDVSRGFSEARLHERGRSDDKTAANVKARLDWYDTDVVPALGYFRKNGTYRVHDIRGEQAIAQVHKEIIEKIFS